MLLEATYSLPSDRSVRIHFLPSGRPRKRASRKNAEPAFANSAFSSFAARGDSSDPERPCPEPAEWLAADNPGNPFGVPILDLTSNLGVTSTTKDLELAERSLS
jgi:hypothetical protein